MVMVRRELNNGGWLSKIRNERDKRGKEEINCCYCAGEMGREEHTARNIWSDQRARIDIHVAVGEAGKQKRLQCVLSVGIEWEINLVGLNK